MSGRAGSPADLVVVDRDPVTGTPDELLQTGVIATTWTKPGSISAVAAHAEG